MKNSLKSILEQIEEVISSIPEQERLAAFDADGTLWPIDVGERFFQYQIHQKLVDLPEKPFEHYETLKRQNPEEAYLWLAQVNEGQRLEQVRAWAKEALGNLQDLPIFDFQREIIGCLKKYGVQVFVVTASVKWAVEPAVALFGLSPDHVVGVETKVQNGVVGREAAGPITYKKGKVKGLLQKTNGKRPFFCAGNTMGDIDLLHEATHIRLAIGLARAQHKLYQTEQELQKVAREQGWWCWPPFK